MDMLPQVAPKRHTKRKDTLEVQHDCYFTHDSVAKQCVASLPTPKQGTFLVEPSAGGGAFVRALEERFPDNPLDALDLMPADGAVRPGNWFQWLAPPEDIVSDIWVVGNPPFNKDLDHHFFQHAAKQGASLIAMILPRSWCRAQTQRRVCRRYILKTEIVLPENSFHHCGKQYSAVRCVWQVWHRMADSEPDRLLPQPIDYSATAIKLSNETSRKNVDVVVQRAGERAGGFMWDPSVYHKYVKSRNFIYLYFPDRGFLEWLRSSAFTLERDPMVFESSSFAFINSEQLLGALDKQHGVYLTFFATDSENKV